MPYPRSVQSAFAAQMEAEQVLHALAQAALSEWAGYVRPVLSLDDSTPDDAVTAAADLDHLWTVILEHLYLHGAGLLFAQTMLEAAAGMGVSFPPAPDGAVVTPPPVLTDQRLNIERLRRRAERIVTRITGLTIEPEPITAAGRRKAKVQPPYTIRDNQAAYLSQARSRYTGLGGVQFYNIRQELDQGLAAGEDPARMAARVQKHLSGDAVSNLANVIARTESAATMTSAVIATAKVQTTVAGKELQKAWVCTIDGKTRKDHFRADGQRVMLAGKFKIGRFTVDHPGDGPPETARNCRCAVITLRVNELLPGEEDRQTERGSGDSTVRHRAGSQQDEIDRRAADGQNRARETEPPPAPPKPKRVKSTEPTDYTRNPVHADYTDAQLDAVIDDADWIFKGGVDDFDPTGPDALAIKAEVREVKAEKRYRVNKARLDRIKAEKYEAEEAEISRLMDEEGYEYEQGVEVVRGISYEQQMRAAALAQLRGYGRSFDEATRNAYQERLRDEIMLEAETATKGAFVKREFEHLFTGTRAKLDYSDLWRMPADRAEKYASDEVRAYWDENGRVTLEDFRESWLRGDSGYAGRSHREDFHQ